MVFLIFQMNCVAAVVFRDATAPSKQDASVPPGGDEWAPGVAERGGEDVIEGDAIDEADKEIFFDGDCLGNNDDPHSCRDMGKCRKASSWHNNCRGDLGDTEESDLALVSTKCQQDGETKDGHTDECLERWACTGNKAEPYRTKLSEEGTRAKYTRGPKKGQEMPAKADGTYRMVHLSVPDPFYDTQVMECWRWKKWGIFGRVKKNTLGGLIRKGWGCWCDVVHGTTNDHLMSRRVNFNMGVSERRQNRGSYQNAYHDRGGYHE